MKVTVAIHLGAPEVIGTLSKPAFIWLHNAMLQPLLWSGAAHTYPLLLSSCGAVVGIHWETKDVSAERCFEHGVFVLSFGLWLVFILQGQGGIVIDWEEKRDLCK